VTTKKIIADYPKSRFELSVMLEIETSNSQGKFTLLILSAVVVLNPWVLFTLVDGFGVWSSVGERHNNNHCIGKSFGNAVVAVLLLCLMVSGCGCTNKKRVRRQTK
jgi:hypothetical protein